jgi:uncharacterized protein YkwD
MARRIAAVIFVGALLAALLPAATASAQASGDNQCWTYKDSERGFARKMNAERTGAGLGKLSLDPELSKAARVHTNEMIRRDELFHTSNAHLRERVTNWILLGENVGVGGSVRSLHEAFMNSPAHRDNVMHVTYRHVGIGVRKANGRMWVTIIFEAVTDPGTTLDMPRCSSNN